MGFIACVMYCCTQVLVPPNNVWSEKDQQVLDRTRTHCKETYSKSPCLIKLKKVEESIYSALCGKNNNEN